MKEKSISEKDSWNHVCAVFSRPLLMKGVIFLSTCYVLSTEIFSLPQLCCRSCSFLIPFFPYNNHQRIITILISHMKKFEDLGDLAIP